MRATIASPPRAKQAPAIVLVAALGALVVFVDARPAHPASDPPGPGHPEEILDGTVSGDGAPVEGAIARLLRVGSLYLGKAAPVRTPLIGTPQRPSVSSA
jgi:hypothetical protein